MMFAQTNKCRFASSLITILLFWGIEVCLCQAQEADRQGSALGELRFEGKYIEGLVLRRKDGSTERFDQPDETIRLPAGEYRLLETHLKGGYTCRSSRTPAGDWVTIAEDNAAVLKVGAPLKQTVRARRRGRILVLNHELLGVGGEIYAGSDRTKPPTFTVYKGDKEIASDKFELG
jgi:hypothetical protein